MDHEKEYFACLALKHTPRLGPSIWKPLFEKFDTVYDVVQSTVDWPVHCFGKKAVVTAAKKCRSEVWREKAESEFRAARQARMNVLTWYDPQFPECLRQIPDPPCMIYYTGDVSLLKNPSVAVVGARECTSMGLAAAGKISAQLSRIGITVVSGLALGIDRQAHLGGLSGLGSSIAVLGCGLDADYPYDNSDVRQVLDDKGLVITEYGPGVGPRAGHFPYRNRLISALSLGVLVAEAAHNSGSLITARLAAEQGKDVFALPGPLGQPTFTGCHRLIKQGAALVEDAGDIVEILRYDFARELDSISDPVPSSEEETMAIGESKVKDSTKRKATARKKNESDTVAEKVNTPQVRQRTFEREGFSLNPEEREVMNVIGAVDRVHIDTLGRELDWASAQVSKVLLMLEIRGAVQQLPGMWYLAKEA